MSYSPTAFSGKVTLTGSTSGSLVQNASAVTTSYSITWPSTQGAANTYPVNDGSGNLTWTTVAPFVFTDSLVNSGGTVTLVNDSALPGDNMYYGTNGSGVRGYYTFPTSVSSVSVTSANGFAGSVANPTSTPAITLSTTVTGLLKGDGTAISAATAGTDYVIPSGSITGTSSNITSSSNTSLTSLSNLATVGTITSGTWNGTAIAIPYGGTGATTATSALSNLGAANNTLSNLGTTSINANLIPTGNVTTSIGLSSNVWSSVYGANFQIYDAFSDSIGNVHQTGFADLNVDANYASGGHAGNINLTTAASNSVAAGNINLSPGNGTGFAGGSIILTPGTGSTNGKITLNDQSGTITAGQVWTATASSGAGHWATLASSANTTLSNLTSPTAINQNLLSATNATYTLGSPSNMWISAGIYHLLYDSGTGGGVALDIGGQAINDTSGSPSINWNSRILKDPSNGPSLNWSIRNLVTSGSTIIDWSLSGGQALLLQTLNETGSANSSGISLTTGTTVNGNSGGISLTPGTASGSGNGGNVTLTPGTGSTNGKIVLNDLSGTITSGQLWTATASSGAGHWVNPPSYTLPLVNTSGTISVNVFTGATNITDVSTTWTAVANATTGSGGSITKSGINDNWGDSGAFTSQSVTSGESINFTSSTSNATVVAGLSATNSGNSYTNIQFGFGFIGNMCEVYENGSGVFAAGTFTNTDVFTVALNSGTITYLKNGSVIYTSSGSPASTLYGKVAMYGNGDGLLSAYFGLLIGTNGTTGVVPQPLAGQANYFLRGDATWDTIPLTPPGGANTQIQFNNSGTFGGSSNLTWNGSSLVVNGTVSVISSTNNVVQIDPTGSTVQVLCGDAAGLAFSTVQIGSITSANNSAAVSFQSGSAGANHASGAVTLTSGSGGSGAAADSGNVTVSSGNASAGNSGNINISVGTSSSTAGSITLTPGTGGANGTIRLNDLSGTITAGQVWTATASNGAGHWATSSSGSTFTSQALTNNQSTPTPVTGLIFDHTVSQAYFFSYWAYYAASLNDSGGAQTNVFALYEPVNGSWVLQNVGSDGDGGFTLTINPTTGQVYYTTGDITSGGSNGTFISYTLYWTVTGNATKLN